MNENTIIGTVPAANELHKVPGFDPMKHLHRAVNAQGESVMRLEPRYQRLWFRMACPNGRMLLNPLRITDQLAIFEAKVFFHKEDPTPASSFTANKTAQETPNYIRAAQDEALKEALDNAGFGIQLCDVTQAPGDAGGHVPSAPSAQATAKQLVVEEQTPPPAQNAQLPGQEAPAAPAQAENKLVPAAPPAASAQVEAEPAAKEPEPTPQPAAQEVKPAPVEAPVAQAPADTAAQEVKPKPVEAPANAAPQEATAPSNGQSSILEVLNFPAPAEEPAPAQKATVGSAEPHQEEAPAQAEPNYTNDTPMEEILELMTLEDARAIVVQEGTCKGWTMGQVAERRPSSLQFFLTAFCKCGNIQKAAATLLIQERQQKKAG